MPGGDGRTPVGQRYFSSLLVVNKKINVRSDYRRLARAMVDRLLKTGAFHIEDQVTDPTGKTTVVQRPGKLDELHGMLAFIDKVDLENVRKGADEPDVVTSKELIYRRFLLYRIFYAAPQPVLVCEGKTDLVYLTHAIRALATANPQLASIDPKTGSITIIPKRFRYTKSSTGRILGIDGGAPDLGRLILTYCKERPCMQAPGLLNPVILVLDNDSGLGKIFNIVTQVSKKKPDKTHEFVHVIDNIYIVLVPLSLGSTGCEIEDLFFDDALKAVLPVGRTFDRTKDYSTATHYGKAEFAYKVIEPNADKLDFSGFQPLLDRIGQVIGHHKATHAGP